MEPTLIYETVHGSRCYGLSRAGSDIDLKGIIVGPPSWYFGFRGGPEQLELDGGDHVHFEIRKFLKLIANANPTILEVLFTDEEHHRTVTAAGRRLLDARESFLCAKVGETFGGYALGQLKRIRTHRKWLLSPPKKEPTRADFGLPEQTLIPKDQQGAAETLMEKGEKLDVSDNFLEVLGREKRYRSARTRWQQYQQWKKHRNPKRSALEAKHGYDTKHAMHLIRLQRMAVEILSTREVVVTRPDREELLAIRDGAWSYDELVEHAEKNGARIRAAAKETALPRASDEDAIEALGVSIVQEVLRGSA